MSEYPGLELADLEVRYRDHVAVRPLSLRQPPGSILAVTGPSAAGKSSLLWAICRGVKPALGTVTMAGDLITNHQQAVAAGISLIPQGNGLAKVLTARENVMLPLSFRRAGDHEPPHDTATRTLAAVGMTESGGHLVEELSGGQQQRVAVARGIAMRSRVLLADEPTSELDAANRDKVLALLRREADRGAVVLLATHDDEAADMCDAHATLLDGELHWLRPFETANGADRTR